MPNSYTIDISVSYVGHRYGSITVVANNEDEARAIIRNAYEDIHHEEIFNSCLNLDMFPSDWGELEFGDVEIKSAPRSKVGLTYSLYDGSAIVLPKP